MGKEVRTPWPISERETITVTMLLLSMRRNISGLNEAVAGASVGSMMGAVTTGADVGSMVGATTDRAGDGSMVGATTDGASVGEATSAATDGAGVGSATTAFSHPVRYAPSIKLAL